jgi:hypothetical protein
MQNKLKKILMPCNKYHYNVQKYWCAVLHVHGTLFLSELQDRVVKLNYLL